MFLRSLWSLYSGTRAKKAAPSNYFPNTQFGKQTHDTQLLSKCKIWKANPFHPVRDAPLDFKGGAGSFCKKKPKKLDPLKGKKKKKKKLNPHIEEKRLNHLTHMERNKKIVLLGWKKKKKTYPHTEEGEKYTPGTSVIPRGGGGHSQKEGIFLICDNDILIQSAACRWMLWTSNIVWSMSNLCT